MKTYRKLIVFVLVFFALSCDKEETKPTTNNNNNNGTTTTVPAFDASVASTSEAVAETSFKISSTIKENGGSAITQHGHVWSDTKTEPTNADSKTELGASSGPFPLKFTSEIKSLKANTTYNVRAYATNDKGTSYGAVVQVKTASQPINGGDLMALITDPAQSRQVAVYLVGRMLTTWKLSLIDAISGAVAQAAQLALAGHIGGGDAAGEQ